MISGVDTKVVLDAILAALRVVPGPWTRWGVVVEHQGDELKVVPMPRTEFVQMLESANADARGVTLAQNMARAVGEHANAIPVLILPADDATIELHFVCSGAAEGARVS